MNNKKPTLIIIGHIDIMYMLPAIHKKSVLALCNTYFYDFLRQKSCSDICFTTSFLELPNNSIYHSRCFAIWIVNRKKEEKNYVNLFEIIIQNWSGVMKFMEMLIHLYPKIDLLSNTIINRNSFCTSRIIPRKCIKGESFLRSHVNLSIL